MAESVDFAHFSNFLLEEFHFGQFWRILSGPFLFNLLSGTGAGGALYTVNFSMQDLNAMTS